MTQFKNTKIGRLPVEWDVKKIKNLTDVKGGKRLPKGENLVDYKTLHPYIRVTDVYMGGVSLDKIKYLTEEIHKTIKNYTISSSDLFVTVAGTLGVVGEIPPALDGANLTENADKLTNIKCHKDFLLYCLMSPIFQKAIEADRTSNAQPKLALNKIQDTILPVPPLAEQQKIASILRGCDAIIAATQKLIAALQHRHKGLMQQLLSGKKRVKGFEKTTWHEVRLGNIFKERNETNCNDLPLLSITEHRGVIYRDELVKKDTSNEDKSKYRRICVGDIGYNTMRMWQGRSAVSSLEGIVSPAYTIVTPTAQADVNYFGYLFKIPLMVHTFWRHSQGLVDDTLNCKYDNFQKIKIDLPSLAEQQKIADILRGSEREIALHQKRLVALQQQKRGLMQVLLTGKVRV